jgi:hypothetical protein
MAQLLITQVFGWQKPKPLKCWPAGGDVRYRRFLLDAHVGTFATRFGSLLASMIALY